MDKEKIIQKLGLKPLPAEGGYFRETYRSPIFLPEALLNLNGVRSSGTAIYYLVTPTEFSALHRLRFDEIFHFYCGDPVEMLQLDEKGHAKRIVLGSDILGDQLVQAVIPAGVWQGTRLIEGGKWALLGTTMAPGFDFKDFELGDRRQLIDRFPSAKEAILNLTRENG